MPTLLVYIPSSTQVKAIEIDDLVQSMCLRTLCDDTLGFCPRVIERPEWSYNRSVAQARRVDQLTVEITWPEHKQNLMHNVQEGVLTLRWTRQEDVLTSTPTGCEWVAVKPSGFSHGIQVGQALTNQEIAKTFAVSNQGGMRRSLANNCLVLISDPTKDSYVDTWDKERRIIQYTGMGVVGDQDIDYAQNYTLAQALVSDVYLFEGGLEKNLAFRRSALEQKLYRFAGRVRLAGEPYMSEQADKTGKQRKVVVFPLQIEPVMPAKIYPNCVYLP